MSDRLWGLVVRVPGYISKGSEFDSRRYHIFWEVVGLERDPLSLVSTIEELRGRKSNGFCPESREYVCRDPSRWPRGTLYPQKLALTSPTSGDRSVGIRVVPVSVIEVLKAWNGQRRAWWREFHLSRHLVVFHRKPKLCSTSRPYHPRLIRP
jgi:hypothetical protein